MQSGKLIIFSAPSGAGKTTLVKKVLQEDFNLEFSISACSRPMRHNEVHKKDYHFLEIDEFKKKIANNDFVEWEEVYENQYYGTLKSELERIWAKNNNVIFDVDVVGGLNIKKQYKDNSLAIFIMPPSVEELEKRLRIRSSDSHDQIEERVTKAEKELSYANQFDKIIINDNLHHATEEVIRIVSEFLD